MRKLITMTAFAAALLGSTAAVHADTSNQKWGKVGGWSIIVDPSTKGCFATGGYQDGSLVRLGFDATDDNKLYLFFGNTKWTTVKDGGKYPLRFSFDGGSAAVKTADRPDAARRTDAVRNPRSRRLRGDWLPRRVGTCCDAAPCHRAVGIGGGLGNARARLERTYVAQGQTPCFADAASFRDRIARGHETWARVAREANITVD